MESEGCIESVDSSSSGDPKKENVPREKGFPWDIRVVTRRRAFERITKDRDCLIDTHSCEEFRI